MKTAMPGIAAASASNGRQWLAGIALAIILGGLAYFSTLGWDTLFGRTTYTAEMDPTCNPLESPCSVQFADGKRLSLTLESKPLTSVPSLLVMADTQGLELDGVQVEFEGVRMNMGTFRTPLSRVGDSTYAGDAVLAVCVRKRMAWSATLAGDGDSAIYRAIFTFNLSNH